MSSIEVNGYEIPNDLFYTEKHEWAKVQSDNNVKIGITDYAQKNLHEIVYVELPEIGLTVNRMMPIGTVESIKSVAEIYSPLSGGIIMVNEKLLDSPELVNESPFGDGWIAIIKPKALNEELGKLMTPEQYAEFIKKLLEE